MPTIIGRRVEVQPQAAELPAVPDVGGVFDALSKPFLDSISGDLKRGQLRLANEKTAELARIAGGKGRLAEMFRSGQISDPGALSAEGILGDLDPKQVAGYRQFDVTTRQGPESKDATTAAMAVPGSNYGNTVAGTREDNANKRTLQGMQEATKLRVADNAPATALVNGVPTNLPWAQAKGLPASVGLSEQQGAEARRLLSAPAGEPGSLEAASAPRQKLVGAQASGDELVNATFDDGTTSPVYAKPDGLYDVQTGQKIAKTATSVGKLQATNAGDLQVKDPQVAKLVEARTATTIAVNAIDSLDKALSKPGSDAAVGWLGKSASVVNNVRSQVEAATKLAGGIGLDTALQQNPEAAALVRKFSMDPGLAVTAQRLGIDNATLQSRIADLSYMIARTQDPSGRISGQDVEKAAATIGASLQDPVAGRAVLSDLRNSLVDRQSVREKVLSDAYSGKFPIPLNTGAPAQAAPSAGVVRWGRDANGRPVPVQ